MKCEKGFIVVESIVALAILGIVAVFFLGSIGTATNAAVVNDEQSIAESLVRDEAEYIKECAYQYSATEYPADPALDIPDGWSVPEPSVEPLHETDDGIQKVTITVQRNGETKLSALIYKVDR
jgi:type II secretory pathway pseudopilin PulG